LATTDSSDAARQRTLPLAGSRWRRSLRGWQPV